MTTEPTPGPWRVMWLPKEPGPGLPRLMICREMGIQEIAHVVEGNLKNPDEWEERLANARLLAASHELRDGLRDMVELARDMLAVATDNLDFLRALNKHEPIAKGDETTPPAIERIHRAQRVIEMATKTGNPKGMK